MIEALKRILPAPLWRITRACGTAVITPFRFSFRTGHWGSSLRSKAIDVSGNPLPWYTYPAIDFLAARRFDGKTVLEFGGGQSTLWWSPRTRHVTTIEADPDWFRYLEDKMPGNVALHHVPRDGRAKATTAIRNLIAQSGKFDIIVIDGHYREEMVDVAFDVLNYGGCIVIDNSESYGMFDLLKNRNCRRIDFFGFAPGNSRRHCTSIVYVGDCFLLSPQFPIPSPER